VSAAVLLIVGGADRDVLQLNRTALGSMKPPARLQVVPAATHLFEEPGALERVAEHARDWFSLHLR
jgi:putative phosphoribosyl transferase